MRMSADHATINTRHTEVFLKGDVTLFQEPTSNEPFVRVKTGSLFYSSVENIARTGDPVRVTRGRSELHGVGMLARPNTGQITILADTRMVMPEWSIEPNGKPGRTP
jgi:LPS export ABC transporter protein LptC